MGILHMRQTRRACIVYVQLSEGFLPDPCHSHARCISATGRRTDKGLWETEPQRIWSELVMIWNCIHGYFRCMIN
ncbi:unnamed protein product [Acanthoscelides obtectus]|uniref:Uncharacterized protein n=1 Tax=Acanthoscelides obtectus TaxID=200917 RepID=A0A9P0KI39_ACAOB|nr:unnamed protein product [Acanthoscelides obtectus]CAK1667669.1 hypothetical protein AOBTE_LOCUS25978 [Acanthoscelides obtectus]